MSKRVLIGFGVIAMIALALFVAPPFQPSGFRAWLSEIRDGDHDWGWNLLDGEVQRAYGGDRSLYERDMAAAEWDSLVLGLPVDVWEDDGFVLVQAELQSDVRTVPSFLFERRIVHGICGSDGPEAIGVFEDRRPFRGGVFVGGGLTGGQARCNAQFTDAQGQSP